MVLSINVSAQSRYTVANKFSIEGDAGWDYLTSDDSTGRLFVSHSTIVQVLDENTGKIVGTISDTKGVHGIALAQDLNKGFISNGKDSSVTVFDLKTLATIEKVSVTGRNPDAILYDPFTQRVFTFNAKSNNATVIDAKTDKVIGTIPLDGNPEFAVSDGKGHVYANIESKSKVDVIDPKSMTVLSQWSLDKGEEPSGLALDNDHGYLFSVCDNKLMVILNARDGRVVTTLPIGERVDGAAFDPTLQRAYSSNGDGTLTVVQEEANGKFSVLENVVTQRGARTVTVNRKTHHVYLPTAEYNPAPEPTSDNPKPRPSVKAGTFVVLEVAPNK